ncbi:MAG: hypothetical protein JWN06_1470 [Propionibacteriaceae bacterium]|jgi:hypothetical protein|nr:hypothetical protein [Propionibacteriaceae bacterium]
MTKNSEEDILHANRLAQQAADTAAQLKSGSWESVQGLALTSIALSLAQLAARPRGFPSAD